MFTEDDYRTAREFVQLFCPKPDGTIHGLLEEEAIAEGKQSADLTMIIPCYNAEKYIKQCLDSVVDHPFVNRVEILVIDDGSTDHTPEIVDGYAGKSGVTVLHQENQGVACTRNTGIRLSKSKYLYFLDADDYVDAERLDRMLSFALEQDADTVESILFNVTEGRELRPDPKTETLQFREIAHMEISGYIGGILIRTAFFQHFCFPEHYLFEDTIMYLLLAPSAKKCYRYDAAVYAYRLNPEGITATSSLEKKGLDSFWMMELMLDSMEALGIRIDDQVYSRILRMVSQTYFCAKNREENLQMAVFIATCGILKRWNEQLHTDNKFRAMLQKALLTEDYQTYRKSCELVHQAALAGM